MGKNFKPAQNCWEKDKSICYSWGEWEVIRIKAKTHLLFPFISPVNIFHYSLKKTAGNHSASLDCHFKRMWLIQLTENAYNMNSTAENRHYNCHRRGGWGVRLHFSKLIKKFQRRKQCRFWARSGSLGPGVHMLSGSISMWQVFEGRWSSWTSSH